MGHLEGHGIIAHPHGARPAVTQPGPGHGHGVGQLALHGLDALDRLARRHDQAVSDEAAGHAHRAAQAGGRLDVVRLQQAVDELDLPVEQGSEIGLHALPPKLAR